MAVAPLVAEHGLWGAQASVAAAPRFSSSVDVAYGLSGSKVCGILPD